jgi:hypothetical protein
MGELLRPGGIALFTGHGTACLTDIAADYGERYRDRADEVRRSFDERGTAYVSYGYYDDEYGLAWHSEQFVRDAMKRLHGEEVELLRFEAAGLEPGSQDVYAFRRRPS